jgi:hypothetical protein
MVTPNPRLARTILAIGFLAAAAATTQADDRFNISPPAIEPPAPRPFDLTELAVPNILPCTRGSVKQRLDCLNLVVLRQAQELYTLHRMIEQMRKPQVMPLGSLHE